MAGETPEETRKRMRDLPDDAANVGEPDAGIGGTRTPVKKGEDDREFLAGPSDSAKRERGAGGDQDPEDAKSP